MTELLPPAEGGRVRKRAAGVKSSKAEELLRHEANEKMQNVQQM